MVMQIHFFAWKFAQNLYINEMSSQGRWKMDLWKLNIWQLERGCKTMKSNLEAVLQKTIFQFK